MPEEMRDPRIDPLGRSAVLTATQVRLTFAPRDADAKPVALKVSLEPDKIAKMQSMLKLGRVHIQVKEGFGEERSVELSLPEMLLIFELADRFITELPNAERAANG